mgnify:CR=1 FL=1
MFCLVHVLPSILRTLTYPVALLTADNEVCRICVVVHGLKALAQPSRLFDDLVVLRAPLSYIPLNWQT